MPYLDSANYELPFQGDSATSKDAALAAARFVGKQGLTVLDWFVSRGTYGGTQREAAAALNIGRASICARVRALEQQGKVRKTAERRGGCTVYVVS